MEKNIETTLIINSCAMRISELSQSLDVFLFLNSSISSSIIIFKHALIDLKKSNNILYL